MRRRAFLGSLVLAWIGFLLPASFWRIGKRLRYDDSGVWFHDGARRVGLHLDGSPGMDQLFKPGDVVWIENLFDAGPHRIRRRVVSATPDSILVEEMR